MICIKCLHHDDGYCWMRMKKLSDLGFNPRRPIKCYMYREDKPTGTIRYEPNTKDDG